MLSRQRRFDDHRQLEQQSADDAAARDAEVVAEVVELWAAAGIFMHIVQRRNTRGHSGGAHPTSVNWVVEAQAICVD